MPKTLENFGSTSMCRSQSWCKPLISAFLNKHVYYQAVNMMKLINEINLQFGVLCVVQCHVSPVHASHPGWAGRELCPSLHFRTPVLTSRPWSELLPTPWWPTSTTRAPARLLAALMVICPSEASGKIIASWVTHLKISCRFIMFHTGHMITVALLFLCHFDQSVKTFKKSKNWSMIWW